MRKRSRISYKSKIREGRGKGEQADYLPWIKAREINSLGVTHNIIDWKHGRTIEFLSEGEAMEYYILRWDDNVIDIREQFPLPLDETNMIAEKAGLMPVNKGEDCMTTDLLVTMKDGTLKAYSVKADRSETEIPRNVEKLWIEKMYWQLHGVGWTQVYKEDMDRDFVDNIRLSVEYYDAEKVHDRISVVKHFIARKELIVDMKNGPLDFVKLSEEYGGSLLWKK